MPEATPSEAKQTLLLKQLKKKIGKLPRELEVGLNRLDVDQLDHLVMHAFDLKDFENLRLRLNTATTCLAEAKFRDAKF